jgi:hypothetical protein
MNIYIYMYIYMYICVYIYIYIYIYILYTYIRKKEIFALVCLLRLTLLRFGDVRRLSGDFGIFQGLFAAIEKESQ